MAKKRVYAEITKVEDQDDGTIKVYGIASTGSEDSDGETITADAMKAAIPDYMKFGAVREMHQPSAAGTALSIEVNDDGVTEFSALIVDEAAIKKVKTEVYKGFSVGGRVTQRDPLNKKIIKGLNLFEVSLVDRPANPDAVISMYKSADVGDDAQDELAEMLEGGKVTHAQLLELVKAAGVTSKLEADDGLAAQPTEDTIAKGMYDLQAFASALSSLAYICSCAQWETEAEGDGSMVPQALREWLVDGVKIFREMTREETEEMLQALGATAVTPDVIAAAAKVLGEDKVAKAGARYSAATKEALRKIHKMLDDGSQCMKDLGYEDAEEDEADKAAKAATTGSDEPAAKTQVEMTLALDSDAVAKALAPVQAEVAKVAKENEELRAQLATLSKRAVPSKVVHPAAITKAQDSAPVTDATKADEVVPPEGTMERAQYEMKKSLSTGIRLRG